MAPGGGFEPPRPGGHKLFGDSLIAESFPDLLPTWLGDPGTYAA
jgi:hypothetical protein